MKKRYAILGLLTGLLGGYFLAYVRMDAQSLDISPGDTIVSMSEDQVMFVGYTTKALTFTAQRARPGGMFDVQVSFADGSPSQHCGASADLGGQLGRFSKFVARRKLSVPKEVLAEFPVELGFLDIRGQIPEPQAPMLVQINKDGTSIAFIFDGDAAEMTIPVSAFKKLEAGCTVLAQR